MNGTNFNLGTFSRGSSSAYDFDNKRHLVLKVADSHPKDSGNYTCIASNSQGTIQRFFIVEIEGRASAQEPKILPGNPENKTLLIGEQLRLECRIANEGTTYLITFLKRVNYFLK